MTADEKAHERILAGADEGDVMPAEVLEKATEAMKDRWLAILMQLTNSHRFNKFLDNNFVIRDVIDDEAQTIETQVIEKPVSVGPPLTGKQIYKLRQTLQLSGCTDVDKAFNDLMKVLGQEEDSGIILSSDVKAAQSSQADLKNKLDA